MTVTVTEALDEGTRRLSLYQERSPRLDAELLLAHVLGANRAALYASGREMVAPGDLEAYWNLLERREHGCPVAYLVGWREFYSRRFTVTPAVLIPRPETETLVEASLEVLRRSGIHRPRVLDVGTGSGIVAATLALEAPGASVVAVELSEEAAHVAEANFRALRAPVELLHGDLFGPVQGRFDLIASNPPYVGTERGPQPEENVRRNEPAMALFSGPTGMEVLDRLIEEAPLHLMEGGSLLVEVAPHLSEGVEGRMRLRGFRRTRLVPDLSGLPRVVTGFWEEEADEDP